MGSNSLACATGLSAEGPELLDIQYEFVYVTHIGVIRDCCVSVRPLCLCMCRRSGPLCVCTSSMLVYVTHIGIVRDCCVSLWSSTPMFVYAVASDRDGSGLLCVCTSSMFVYVTQIGISVCLYVQYVCVCDTDRDLCVSLRPVCLCM